MKTIGARIRSLTEGESSRLARRVLFAFIVTFIASRTVVFLIMSRRLPMLYFRYRGTHVHHLNYGIVLLAITAGALLFSRSNAVLTRRLAFLYGVALALTFDEFGMWLHLGGSYWQRASVDAVVVIACLLALLGFAPDLERWRLRHRWAAVILIVAIIGFGAVLVIAGHQLGKIEGPKLRELELSSTP